MNNPYLLEGLGFGPQILANLLDQIDPSRYDEAIDPERFTLREAVAHMADWEPIFYERMRAAVERPGSAIQGIDEGQRAIDQEYAHTDPKVEIESFRAARAATIAYLSECKPEDWSKVVQHSGRGEMTLYDLAAMELGHDLYHAEQLTRYLTT